MSLKLDTVRASYIDDFKLYPHFTNQLSSIWAVKCLITIIHVQRAEFDAPQTSDIAETMAKRMLEGIPLT